MHQEVKDILNQRRKLVVLEYAKAIGNARKAYTEFGVPSSSFYEWRKIFEQDGEAGFLRKKPVARSHPKKIKQPVIDKIVHLRTDYQLGFKRIQFYLERYHRIFISESSITRALVKHKINRLPKTASKRTLHTKRYTMKTPDHHVQVDIKFLKLSDASGKKMRRFQYTAIDDATRIRALKIYKRHTQQNAINFIDYVVDRFPFRIHTVRTDRGHEFQAKFHWHVEDQGMRHVYIERATPQLNGKVERSHRTDEEEFYHFRRPHGAFKGRTLV
ncbi:MAG: helix-turn-helix domain-containing protein [Calditrichia bacterium]